MQVGGNAPVIVQSMTNTDTCDVAATVAQVKILTAAGCEIVRVAVPDARAVEALAEIKKQISIPLVADIHFDYRLALAALRVGVDGLRLNPGNINDIEKIGLIAREAKAKKVPIRVGVNAGSLEKGLLPPSGVPTAEVLVKSALHQIKLLEDNGFQEIKVSLKASDVPLILKAYQLLAKEVDYPFHVGVTATGPGRAGIVKSAVGIGTLLAQGIGDTVRVSLTADPVEEVKVAYEILKALGLRSRGIELISCPTCGRTQVNLIQMAEEVEKRLAGIDIPLKVAVMGCVVNGPGEASYADLGIAAGRGGGLLFRQGKVIRRVPENDLVEELVREVLKITGNIQDKHE
ncbi:MAG TPA: 4-hydroxy-3-methylbut-2-en-1-yl diphosphate synthase [Desulfotomaculum sp.]|nr:4-hydroxy-3-methylbut-2-en-1-yl diphosphate synthase [Desulfotomaculum sp.]